MQLPGEKQELVMNQFDISPVLVSCWTDWKVSLSVIFVPMKGAADFFGKEVFDATSEAVILSWTASLVRYVKVSMFYHRQLDKFPLTRVDKI